MRSRYAAFAQDRRDYLLATWHPSTRPAAIEPPTAGLRWLKLEVRRHIRHRTDRASVEFIARSKLGGRAQRLHKISLFVRDSERWFYVSGEFEPAGR